VADYFEECAAALRSAPPRAAANWVAGELFAWMNQSGESFADLKVSPRGLAQLVDASARGEVNLQSAKAVLAEMLRTGKEAGEIIHEKGLQQVSDGDWIAGLVRQALAEYPDQLSKYLGGKETVANWLFGQVMRAAKGKANPQVVQGELERQLKALKEGS
jgi:aspartyl-tRNA(Asn)/glutamyl-tRNA(Gln) amidotransferase subunit B